MANRDIDQTLQLNKNATVIALGYYEGIENREVIEDVAPVLKVKSNGKYPSYGVGSWYDDDEDKVAAHATAVSEYIPPAETWNDYVIPMHARKVAISDAVVGDDAYVPGMVYSDPAVATKRLLDVLFQKYCKTTADLLVATANSAAPGILWDASGATPFDDIQTWVIALKNLIGVGGFHALTTDRVMIHLGEGCRAKYSHTGSMSNYEIVEKLMLRDLGIDKLLISKDAERYVTASAAWSSIWGKNFILYKNAQNPNGFQPTHMATLVPAGDKFIQVMTPYGRDVLDLLGYYIQVRMYYLVKELDTNAVYMGSSVIS